MINQSKKKLVLAISSALTLAACNGGGSGGSTPASASISGTASNGILAAATVCVDLNDNLQCDAAEPSTITDSNGQFSLTGLKNTEIQDKYLIVEIAAGTSGNSSPGKSNVLVRKLPASIAASGSLTAQSINPFSTLIDATDMTLAELAIALGVSEDDLSAETYTDNAAVKNLAAILASKIADELESRVTSSAVNNASVLLTGGFLQNLADVLKQESGLTPTALEAALDGVDGAEISFSSVVDASVEVTATNKDDAKLEGVSVLITAYEAGTNTVLTSISDNSLVVGETDSNGNALINLPEYDQASIDIDVVLEKEGFVTLSKRFKAIEAGDRIPFSMVLTEENQTTISTDKLFNIEAATAASLQTGKPAFTLALVKLKSGEEVILGGSAAAQAMADGDNDNDVQVGLQIPLNRIDTSKVKALSAGIQGFNPAIAQDSQSFPGSFEGIGRVGEFSADGINSEHNNASSADDNNTVVPIISTSFTQIRLEDQDGNEFELAAASEASATADDAPVIYLRVPEDTYKTITEDVNAVEPGIQVPIYVYRSGQGWVMVGLSTLVKYDSNTKDYVEYAGSVSSLISGIGQLYGQVKITEGNEWVRWINIDWPVIAGGVESFDFKGLLRYKGEQGKRYSGSGYIEFDDGSRQWITVSEGRFQYSQPTTESVASTATLSIWNQYTGEYQSFEFDEDDAVGADNSYVLDPNPGLLDNPFQCTVQGKVTKKGGPAAWHYFNLSALRFNQSVTTNANGEFSSISPCDATVTFSGEGVQKTFNVNGTTAGDESSDENNIVGLTVIDLPNQAPRVSGWTNNYQLTVPDTGSAQAVLTAYGSDVDSESLTYSWVCPGTQASSSYVYSSATRTCEVSADMVPDTSETTYLPWSVTVTDTEGASSTYTSNIVANVESRNRAPRISGIQRDNRNLSCSRNTDGLLNCRDNLVVTGAAVEYKLLATDPNGDILKYSSDSLTIASDGLGYFSTTVESGTTSHTINVTDTRVDEMTEKTASVQLNIQGTENQAPVVYMGLNKFAYIAGVDTSALISASLWDDNTPATELRNNVVWELKRGDTVIDTVSITPENSQWRMALTGLSAGTYTLKMTVKDSLLTTVVSRSFTIGSSMAPQINSLTGPSQLALSDLGLLLAPETTFKARIWDDADLSELTISASLLNGENEVSTIAVSLSGNMLSGDFTDLAEQTLSAGDYTLRVTIKDSDNPVVTRDLSIEMALPNNGTVIIVQ